MNEPSRHTVVGDLSDLPSSAMGSKSLIWWGTLGFMLIEGTGFLLAAAAYLYLRGQTGAWPSSGHPPPDLWVGSLFTVGLLASEGLNRWVAAKARKGSERGVRIGVAVMGLVGLVLMAVRGLEFAHLNVRWDHDAYGSAVWLLLFLHATHVLTDLVDTLVLAVTLATHEITENQFSDVNDNCFYWSFVVVTWLPLYGLIYWGPRLL